MINTTLHCYTSALPISSSCPSSTPPNRNHHHRHLQHLCLPSSIAASGSTWLAMQISHLVGNRWLSWQKNKHHSGITACASVYPFSYLSICVCASEEHHWAALLGFCKHLSMMNELAKKKKGKKHSKGKNKRLKPLSSYSLFLYGILFCGFLFFSFIFFSTVYAFFSPLRCIPCSCGKEIK